MWGIHIVIITLLDVLSTHYRVIYKFPWWIVIFLRNDNFWGGILWETIIRQILKEISNRRPTLSLHHSASFIFVMPCRRCFSFNQWRPRYVISITYSFIREIVLIILITFYSSYYSQVCSRIGPWYVTWRIREFGLSTIDKPVLDDLTFYGFISEIQFFTWYESSITSLTPEAMNSVFEAELMNFLLSKLKPRVWESNYTFLLEV